MMDEGTTMDVVMRGDGRDRSSSGGTGGAASCGAEEKRARGRESCGAAVIWDTIVKGT
jgi:hypothetical protein